MEGTRLALWSGGRLTTVYSQSSNVANLLHVSVNDEGTVALRATTRILTVDRAGTQREGVGENEVPRANVFVALFLLGPTINNSGEVAFPATGVSQCDGCTYKKSGSRLLEVSAPSGPAPGGSIGSIRYGMINSSTIKGRWPSWVRSKPEGRES